MQTIQIQLYKFLLTVLHHTNYFYIIITMKRIFQFFCMYIRINGFYFTYFLFQQKLFKFNCLETFEIFLIYIKKKKKDNKISFEYFNLIIE